MIRRILKGLVIAASAMLAAAPVLAGGGPDSKLIDPFWTRHDAESTMTVDHGPWAALLDRHLVAAGDGINRIDYGALEGGEKAQLDGYIRQLEAVEVETLGRDEQMAYWINLYNAVTVKIVAEAYPVESIRDVLSGGLFSPGPWKRNLVTVAGRKLSLNDIEHGILRPIWQDNRIHYAVNCASLGCPNLAPRPYTAANLEEMLDQAARDYVNHPRGTAFDRRGRLDVSRIYSWYDEDFGGNEAGIIAHLKMYAAQVLKARLETVDSIDDYDYDWSLNDAAPGG